MTQDSPLSEADPQSLEALFSKDPLKYTQQDRRTIIDKLIAQRKAWEQAEASGAKSAPRASKGAPKASKPVKGSVEVTFDDLDI